MQLFTEDHMRVAVHGLLQARVQLYVNAHSAPLTRDSIELVFEQMMQQLPFLQHVKLQLHFDSRTQQWQIEILFKASASADEDLATVECVTCGAINPESEEVCAACAAYL